MAPYGNSDREVTYEIVEEIGVISESATGWRKELNLVSWNGGQAKYDIREWAPDRRRMSKGLTLNEQEMRQIVTLLKRRSKYATRRMSSGSAEQGRDPGSGAFGGSRSADGGKAESPQGSFQNDMGSADVMAQTSSSGEDESWSEERTSA